MPERVPEIRLEGFTDAWEQRKLGDIAASFEYGLNAAACEYDGVNKYLRITDIDDDTHEFCVEDLTSPQADLVASAGYLLSEGDLLFARTGASVGKTYLYRPFDGRVFFAGFLIRAKIGDDADPEFVFQSTLTDRYRKYIAITSQRSGQPGVNAQEYSDFELPLPSQSEQKQIGSLLHSLDNLITLHQRERDRLMTAKVSFLRRLYPLEESTTPMLRFDGFSGEWIEEELGSLFNESEVRSSELEILSVSVANGIYPASESERATNPGASLEKYKVVHVGDIVYNSMRMWQGAVYSSQYEGIVSPAYVVARPVVHLYSGFFSYMLRLPYMLAQYKGLSQGNSKDTQVLKFDEFARIKVHVPSLEEQLAVGSFLEKLDGLIRLEKVELEKLKQVKSTLLRKMFV